MPLKATVKNRRSNAAALVRQERIMQAIQSPFRSRVAREKNRYIRKAAEVAGRIRSTTDDDFLEHKTNMREIMESYYRRIIRVMSQEVFESTKASHLNLETKFTFWEGLFVDFVATYGAQKIAQAANTTRSDVQRALRAAIEDPDVVDEQRLVKRVLQVRGISAYRADVIARTETHSAAMYSSINTARNISQETDVQLKKKWVPALDERTRVSHASMVDSEAIAMDGLFDVGGERLEYPGDPSGSAENVINCLHPDTKVWGASPNALTRRLYKGSMCFIQLSNGNNITVTPNHPILTRRGWVVASKIKKTDSVVSTRFSKLEPFGHFDIQNVIPTIENVYNASGVVPVKMGMTTVDVDFHGEPLLDKNVDIIFKKGKLGDGIKAFFVDPFRKLSLPCPDLFQGKALSESLVDIPFFGGFHFTPSFVRGLNLVSLLRFRHFRPLQLLCLRSSSFFDAIFRKSSVNNSSINIKFLRECIDRLSALKKSDDFGSEFVYCSVSGHENIPYNGYVYNLSDDKSYYIGNGIVTHNCRCVLIYE